MTQQNRMNMYDVKINLKAPIFRKWFKNGNPNLLNDFAKTFDLNLADLSYKFDDDEVDHQSVLYCDEDILTYKDSYEYTYQIAEPSIDEAINRATFYQDKKNINKSTLKVMHEWDQYFKGYFKRVEIDNEVDLHKIEQIKAELLATVKKLPRIKNNLPILRFRKLGNYHAWGMFTSINNTIALDFRNNGVDGSCIQSFIHEYGHYLDSNWHRQQGVLSLDEPYHLILHTVQNYLLSHDVKHKYKNSEYILAPSEIYARSFERYLSSNGLHNNLIRQPNVYKDKNLIEYACFNEQQINHYFDHMFPTIKNALKL